MIHSAAFQLRLHGKLSNNSLHEQVELPSIDAVKVHAEVSLSLKELYIAPPHLMKHKAP